MMQSTAKEDTINKSTLLNWLNSANAELSVVELGQWIEARTSGKYILIKKEQATDIAAMTILTDYLNNKT